MSKELTDEALAELEKLESRLDKIASYGEMSKLNAKLTEAIEKYRDNFIQIDPEISVSIETILSIADSYSTNKGGLSQTDAKALEKAAAALRDLVKSYLDQVKTASESSSQSTSLDHEHSLSSGEIDDDEYSEESIEEELSLYMSAAKKLSKDPDLETVLEQPFHIPKAFIDREKSTEARLQMKIPDDFVLEKGIDRSLVEDEVNRLIENNTTILDAIRLLVMGTDNYEELTKILKKCQKLQINVIEPSDDLEEFMVKLSERTPQDSEYFRIRLLEKLLYDLAGLNPDILGLILDEKALINFNANALVNALATDYELLINQATTTLRTSLNEEITSLENMLLAGEKTIERIKGEIRVSGSNTKRESMLVTSLHRQFILRVKLADLYQRLRKFDTEQSVTPSKAITKEEAIKKLTQYHSELLTSVSDSILRVHNVLMQFTGEISTDMDVDLNLLGAAEKGSYNDLLDDVETLQAKIDQYQPTETDQKISVENLEETISQRQLIIDSLKELCIQASLDWPSDYKESYCKVYTRISKVLQDQAYRQYEDFSRYKALLQKTPGPEFFTEAQSEDVAFSIGLADMAQNSLGRLIDTVKDRVKKLEASMSTPKPQ